MSHTFSKPCAFEIDVKKSRFLATGFPLQNAEETHEHVTTLRQKYPAATHHCWGWRYGSLAQCSDDGEPSGTAGRPILNVLTRRDIDHALVIVSRWFGGTKLGAGGLVRAYSAATRDLLDHVTLREIVPVQALRITTPLQQGGILYARLKYWGTELAAPAQYSPSDVTFELRVPRAQLQELQNKIENVTLGKAVIKALD